MLTLGGLTYVLTENTTISYARMDVAMLVNDPVLGVFSLRSAVAIAAFAIAAFVMARTRVGRDVIATGSDRRAACVAGVPVDHIIIGVFAVSGHAHRARGLAAQLQPRSSLRRSRSPTRSCRRRRPPSSAAYRWLEAKGRRPASPAASSSSAVLRSGLTAIGVPPYVHDIVTGASSLRLPSSTPGAWSGACSAFAGR